MKDRKRPITSAEAKRSLHALDVLSGRTTTPPPDNRKPVQREADIQAALFEWAAHQSGKYPELRLMFHVPNGGRRDIVTAAKLKREGVKSGVPDICLPVARGQYHGLFIELKGEGGHLQESQRQWISELTAQGYAARVCFGFDEAVKIITNYLLIK